VRPKAATQGNDESLHEQSSHQGFDLVSGWNGWSPDLVNHRFQSAKAANISAASVARLQLKWAFGLPAASSAYNQPTLVDDKIFVGSDSGFVYSLDAATAASTGLSRRRPESAAP
jgi:polyvinyl alcohol dehydrogenase (cytochrome)